MQNDPVEWNLVLVVFGRWVVACCVTIAKCLLWPFKRATEHLVIEGVVTVAGALFAATVAVFDGKDVGDAAWHGVIGGGAAMTLIYLVYLAIAPSQIYKERIDAQAGVVRERDECHAMRASIERATSDSKSRLAGIIEQSLKLHNMMPDDGPGLSSEWKPKYDQWKVDALDAMPTAGYVQRLRTKIRACEDEESVHLLVGEADPWRRVVLKLRDALKEIYDEIYDEMYSESRS